MTIVATTPRLLLRRWEVADAAATQTIYGDAETMRQFGDGSTFTVDQIASSLAAIIDDYATIGYGNYAVVERATQTIIGHCGAHYVASRDCVEADWALGRRWWGRGYATEAAAAVFHRTFVVDGVREILGIANRENHASIAVMRKLGMVFRTELVAHGTASVLYAVTQNDFSLSAEAVAGISLG